MSETPETSQSATGPYVAMAASAPSVKARTAAFRDALLVKVPGGDGDWNRTTKDSVWTAGDFIPLAKEKLCPKPGAAHSAPFQPSPYESVMSRVHVAPSATADGTLEVYGAPPLNVVSSEQLRFQPTSFGYEPSEQVIAEEIDGAAGGDGGDGGQLPEPQLKP